jgi:hypothetical protein
MDFLQDSGRFIDPIIKEANPQTPHLDEGYRSRVFD